MKVVFPEDAFATGDWEGQFRDFSVFKMSQLGPGLVLCLGTEKSAQKLVTKLNLEDE